MFKIDFLYYNETETQEMQRQVYFETMDDVADCLNFIGRGLSGFLRSRLETRLNERIPIDSNQYDFLESWLKTYEKRASLKKDRFKGIGY